jgi:L-iditol 2-dehydrogenase
MMAAVLYGKEDLRIEAVPVPDVERGDVLVRVKTALTCGTDVKVFRRGYHARMIVPPALFGHELAGDIVAAGKDVRGFHPGQRVVAANSAPCGECYYCRRDNENLYEIPAHVSYQDAALIEPLACVLRGLDETSIRRGDTVAVIGLGPIGMMFVRLAKVYGARVIAIGRRKSQLDRAARMGADEMLTSVDGVDIVKQVRSLTDGRGVDRGGRHTRGLGDGPAAPAPRRHRQFLRRMSQRKRHHARYVAYALFRDHVHGQLSPHAAAHPEIPGYN